MSMNPEDITKYKSLYLQTSWGYLNMLNKNIAFLLIDNKEDSARDAAYLASHSLKSESLLMGYDQIGKLSEKMEKIFRENKDKDFALTNEILKIMLDCLKKVQVSLEEITETGKEVNLSELIKKLDAVLQPSN